MRRLLVAAMLILATTCLTVPVLAAAADSDYIKFLENLDADRTWNIVSDLAGDRFEGRRTGTHGADLASEYIVSYFASIGLKPAGPDGTYRASFNAPLCQLKRMPTLALVDANDNTLQTFIYKKDFYMRQCSGGGNYSGDVVFAGYGIIAKELSYDDYAGTSVSGKFVIAIAGTPPSDKFSRTDYGNVYSKADNAQSRGAVGLMIVDSPASPTENYIELWSGGWWDQKGFTLLRGSIQMADLLLKDQGVTLSSVQQKIDQNLKPQSFALGKRLRISAEAVFTGTSAGYNVLSYVSGSDPAASQKAVVIGAHYDHGGRDVDGSILRGANDDASGIAVMMEIARVFAAGVRPKWSVLFAAWAGEEEGLVGSKAYVNHPYFPLGGTIAYLNLDMVGGGQGLLCEISQAHRDLLATMTESRQELSISLNVVDPSGDSDHASFEDRDVPNLMLIYWPDNAYHTSRDTPDHVSKEHLIETARLTTLVALKLSQATITAMTLTTEVITTTGTFQTTTLQTTTFQTTPIPQTRTSTTASPISPAGGFPAEIMGIIVVFILVGVVVVVYFRRRNK
jgi:hypothetical protein